MNFLILFFILSNALQGAEDSEFCTGEAGNFFSPVCTDAKYILITGTALTASLYLLENSVGDELTQRAVQKDHLKTYGKIGGDVGYGYLNALYAGGFYFFGGDEGKKSSEQMIEASLYTFGWTMALKKSIYETRPGYPDDHESFPSGHSSFSFAFASVVTANHGWRWGGAAHAAAVFISFSRVDENWHYIHDIVFGATIGASYGWGVFWNQTQRKRPYYLSVIPSLDGASVLLSGNF